MPDPTAITDDERAAIDADIASGTIINDDALAAWVADSTIDDLHEVAGLNPVLAKRVLAAEQARDTPRKGLVDALTKALTAAAADVVATTTTAPLVINTGAPTSRYYRLNTDSGVTAGGNLEPLVSIGMTVAVPTMVEVDGKQEIAEMVDTLHIEPRDSIAALNVPARIIPGTRVVESCDPRVDSALLQTGNWEQIDPPSKTESAAEAKSLSDAVDEAANRSDEER